MQTLTLPLTPEAIQSLRVGDSVRLRGVMLTGRDTAHKWLVETFIRRRDEPSEADAIVAAAR